MAISVPFQEMNGSPIVNWTPPNLSATRKLLVAWGDGNIAVNQALGITTSVPDVFAGKNLPSTMTCQGGIITPFGKQDRDLGLPGSLARYGRAVVTLTYKVPGSTPGTTPPGVNVNSDGLEPFAEMLTQDPSDFRWGSPTGDSVKPQEAPAMMLRGLDYVVRRLEYPFIPIAILDLVGKVNDALITAPALNLSFAAETLLYNPPTISQGQLATTWDMTLRFTYRPTGWNSFWRAKTGVFEGMFSSSRSAQHITYPLGDFTAL